MEIIKENYVSLENAKLLKDKGFDEPCLSYFWEDEQDNQIAYTDRPFTYKQLYSGDILRPTLQMAMKWLRKNHQIFIRPNISFLYPIKWYSEIFCYGDNLKTQQDIKTEYYDSPEEACEAAIKYCLENLI